MRYQFPVIRHLDDVREAIEGRDEFIIAERPWGFAVNYMVSMTDTFPEVKTELDAIRRELRGLLFFPNGQIMARRLHKFFNVQERDETQLQHIDLSQPHVILEKLDGSMITPVETPDGFTWGTKMGITDVAGPVQAWVNQHMNYLLFAQTQMQMGFTPIFEWCSRKQRIVVDYPEDRLVLIAIRNTVTGEYVSLETMQDLAEDYELDCVKTYPGTAQSLEHLIAETRDATGIEGWIIRFADGHMLKLKAEEYLRFHKTKESIALEKNVVDLLVNENIDDAKSFMQDDDRHRVEKFEVEFWKGIADTVQRYEDYFQTMSGLDRKTWAVNHMPTVRKQNPFTPSVMFGMYDGKDARKLVLDIVKKHTNSQTKIDEARILWGGARWSYHFDVDG